MGAHLITILAGCAFDPGHPSAPCNDTPGPRLLEQPLIWALILVVVLATILFVRRRSRRERTAVGMVKSWQRDEGWGVLTSPDVSADIWTFFAAVDAADAGATGFRDLVAGQRVEFRYLKGDQDGYSYVATWVRRLR